MFSLSPGLGEVSTHHGKETMEEIPTAKPILTTGIL
jgi:hypothetical protein